MSKKREREREEEPAHEEQEYPAIWINASIEDISIGKSELITADEARDRIASITVSKERAKTWNLAHDIWQKLTSGLMKAIKDCEEKFIFCLSSSGELERRILDHYEHRVRIRGYDVVKSSNGLMLEISW